MLLEAMEYYEDDQERMLEVALYQFLDPGLRDSFHFLSLETLALGTASILKEVPATQRVTCRQSS